MRKPKPHTASGEAGLSLPEVLVAAGILALVSLGLTFNSITASYTLGKLKRHNFAAVLAYNKLEELYLRNPTTLSDADDDLESGIELEGVTFVRETDVTVNEDGSRTVRVTVHPAHSSHPEEVVLEETLIPRGAK